jgi:hypothetical protein
VHEYTHHKQAWLKWMKWDREKEAYCIQMEWLRDNYNKFAELNYIPLEKLLDKAKGGFKADPALKFSTLVCDASLGLKRWELINKELHLGYELVPGDQMDAQEGRPSAQEPDTGENWDTVVDFQQ